MTHGLSLHIRKYCCFFKIPNAISTQSWSSPGEHSRGKLPKEDALLCFNKEVMATTLPSITVALGFEAIRYGPACARQMGPGANGAD